ncbi:unnamed protein product [Miscanthus lutarioriparius]|uniref:Uncharacterized protein n=1 Tax=Miscanthus lutarioriparius TaxID=422564 RepID=A0A811QE67_9POAL|nr:unnamed protein product [Miscanthus lutarioriparius]
MTGVEAAAISAVASGILKIVGNKLAPLVIRKYTSTVGVQKDLQELQVLVEDINSWLESAGYQALGDDASFSWFKQLKDVAYAVDDVVDEYQLKAERNDASGDGGIVSRYMRRKPESFIFHCKAAKKIKAIKKRFATIVKQRANINIIATSLPGGRHSVFHINKTAVGLSSVPAMDAALILGREMEKHQLISKLIETSDQQKTMIVSIVGLGGSGKTTLAKLVFNDGNTIAKHFKVRLWVHVSQEFDFESIVGKLFEAIVHGKSECHNLQHMVKRISDELTEKMFLLVLDDVWTKDRIELEQFMVLMRSGGSGSRILLTTRNSDVAEAVESAYLFNLPLLSLADSWQLFLQSFGMTVEGLDREFLDVGNEIVNKCGGVPLAIKDVEENYYGRVTCKMHDLIHDLAHSILKDEISLDVPKEGTSLTKSYRYFSLTKHTRILPSKCPFGKARAIYVNNGDDTIFGSTLQNAKHLRSITMESMFVAAIPSAIFKVKILKYLEISRLKCEALLEAISNFWTLQALHMASSDLLDLPKTIDDAHKACLKQKTNLQSLDLEWIAHEAGEVDTELEQAVLDGLEPPPQIKELKINGYSGSQYAEWMQNKVSGRVQGLVHFPFFRVVKLYDFPNLKHLHGLVELPCLDDLELRAMPSLESISGGPFPSLLKLEMDKLPSLGEVWLVAERTIPDDCPKLKFKPHMPLSLENLQLSESSEQLLQSPADQCLGSSCYSNFSHLKKLGLWGDDRTRIWTWVGAAVTLDDTRVIGDQLLSCANRAARELAEPHVPPVSERVRMLSSSHAARVGLTSLQELWISDCPGVASLPQGVKCLSSLELINVNGCPGIKSLPEDIKSLTTLMELRIHRCPNLERLCERGKGEDWHLISHIPNLRIWRCAAAFHGIIW